MISRPRSSVDGPLAFIVPLQTVLGRVTFKVPLTKPISKCAQLRAPPGVLVPALPRPPDAAASPWTGLSDVRLPHLPLEACVLSLLSPVLDFCLRKYQVDN